MSLHIATVILTMKFISVFLYAGIKNLYSTNYILILPVTNYMESCIIATFTYNCEIQP